MFVVSVPLTLFIGTESGRIVIANLISKKFSIPGRELQISGIHRGFLNSIQLDRLSMSDTQGTWLQIDDIHIDYNWHEILNGNLRVDLLAINRIKVSRIPLNVENKQSDSNTTNSYFGYLKMARQIAVSNIMYDAVGSHISGNITVADGREYSGELDVVIDDIALLGKLAGVAAAGSLKSQTSFRYSDDKQSVRLQATCNGLSVEDTISASNLMADITIDNIYCISNAAVKLSSESAHWKELELDHINVQLDSDNGLMAIKSDINGRLVEPFSLSTTGTLTLAESNINLQVATKSANISGIDAGTLALELTAPKPWRLIPVSLPEDSDIAIRIVFDTKIDALSHLPIFVNNIVRGDLAGEISYQKKISDVIITGGCSFNNGYYENYISGTVIDEINIDLKGDGSKISITSGNARDAQSGKMSISGSLDLTSFKDRLLDLKLNLRHFHLLNRDDLKTMVSGEVQIKGKGRDVDLTGLLNINEGRLNLNNLPPTLPPVLVDNTGKSPNAETTATVHKQTKSNLKADITLKTIEPFYILGKGLNSTWEADLHFISNDKELGLKGEVESRSGSFLFLSRKFVLDIGQISFDSNWPPSPVLNIVTIHERADLRARMHISGRADNPKITMDSIPAMPEDEVFSYILFGRNLSSINAFQAVQVASAMQGMRTGNNIDFMQGTKMFLGFDRLGFGTAEDGTDSGGELTTIAMGKYLTEGLYTEINTPLGVGSDTKVTMEYELHPNLTLETEAGINMRPGMGINWKKDY